MWGRMGASTRIVPNSFNPIKMVNPNSFLHDKATYHTYHTMPCHAMPCSAMPCHAMPCHAMPCHAMPCHAMPCHAIPYHTIPYHTIPYHTIPYSIALHITSRHITSHRITSHHITSHSLSDTMLSRALPASFSVARLNRSTTELRWLPAFLQLLFLLWLSVALNTITTCSSNLILLTLSFYRTVDALCGLPLELLRSSHQPCSVQHYR